MSNNKPTELYMFTQDVKAWYYTNGLNDIEHQGSVFKSSQIERSSMQQSSDTTQNGIKFTFPLTNEFAQQFLGFAPDVVTTVAILRGDYDNKTFNVMWRGRVMSAKANDAEIMLECESVFTSIKRPGLRARYELQCRHALYSRNCGVNMSAFKQDVDVAGIERGIVLRVVGLTKKEGWYSGGIAKAEDGATRYIAEQRQNELILTRPFNKNIQGQKVTLYPGCDHLKETCINKFNNFDNFGGFPHIPGKNPFNSGSIV